MTTIIIPARMGSVRLPGKPLKLIRGIPMVERVYRQCIKADVGSVFVATDSEEVAERIPEQHVIMTSTECRNGTERIAEAIEYLPLFPGEMVLNIQGDMPYVSAEIIRKFARFMNTVKGSCIVGTVSKLGDIPEGGVSVVANTKQQALYFSRSPLPPLGTWHVGMYAYTSAALRLYKKRPPSPLEEALSLEQLRFLDYSIAPISVMYTEEIAGPEINTYEDLERINK